MNLSEIRTYDYDRKSPNVFYILDYPNLIKINELTKEKRDIINKMSNNIRFLRIRMNRRNKINRIFEK